MTAVLDICTTALKEIGVIAAGEPLTAEDGADALAMLNRRIDQMAAERLTIYVISKTLFTITPSLGTYTVGTGFAISRPRPMFVTRVNWIDTSTSPDTEYPMFELTEDEWGAIVQRDTEATIPGSYFYEPTFPNGTLHLYPVPTNSNMQGAFYAPAAVTGFAALGDTFALPPGYEEFLVTDLALSLCPSYSKQSSQELRDRAKEARAIVKRSNSTAKALYFAADSLINGGGRFDIYTGGNP